MQELQNFTALKDRLLGGLRSRRVVESEAEIE
jgi:hypothetical protein